MNKKLELIEKIIVLQNDLQKEKAFTNSKETVMHLIYHLFLKSSRTLKAIKAILESDEIDNSYIETLPLLRIQLETYFHLVYITTHDNKDYCVEEYDQYQKLQQKRVANNLFTSNGLRPNRLGAEDLNFIDSHKSFRNSIDVKHLDKLYLLAENIGKYEEYARIYSLLSSFVHYNPSTRVAYSNSVEGKIIYNQFVYNEENEEAVFRYITGISLNSLTYINKYLGIESFERELEKTLIEWHDLFK
ncbi:DUF5677 domain-containing protein [Peribacillus sp. TH24]|uniref:DUF5677 domain-containing protein n=1 Tax=Peribacillus sp. TH24 TaxID=2798483 RepID=UPI001911E9DD|nr:DUF5677 domain-containing protein [Peribacillus sp. TH24]MBK5446052.1 hypothetical protein [Peribacillus sp. TH24]